MGLLFASMRRHLAQLADIKIGIVTPFSPPIGRYQVALIVFFGGHQVDAIVHLDQRRYLDFADRISINDFIIFIPCI